MTLYADMSWKSNLYLIGGSPCSGKSTITDMLAEIYQLQRYRCDDAYFEHGKEANESHPTFSRLFHATGDVVWMRPVSQQISEELGIYREEFPFIVRDLEALARSGPVIAEGAALLPSLVATLGVERHQAIWMVPTEVFQCRHYEQRPWRHDVVRECSDPQLAWENWMARDAGFARQVVNEAQAFAFELITVDGSTSIGETFTFVERYFRLAQNAR